MLSFGAEDAADVLVWFGDPAATLRTVIEPTVQLHLWDCHESVEHRHLLGRPTIAEFAEDLLAQTPIPSSTERIWVGGYSFGAWVAHEAAEQLRCAGQPVAGAFLVDPPRLRIGVARRVSRAARSALHQAWAVLSLGVLGIVPLRGGWADERLRFETRRRAILRYRGSRSEVPTWLFHAEKHGADALPRLRRRTRVLHDEPLGAYDHTAAVRDVTVRDRWIRRLVEVMDAEASAGASAGSCDGR